MFIFKKLKTKNLSMFLFCSILERNKNIALKKEFILKKNIFWIVITIFGTIFSAREENKKSSYIYIKPLEQILEENPSIDCLRCFGKISYDFPQFLESTYPNKGTFDECFILSIPNGRAQGFLGNVLINNSIIEEMIWTKSMNNLNSLVLVKDENVLKIPGKVVVLAQAVADNYCHFMHEILGRLALIEMYNIEYDYLYISCLKPFMLEIFDLWGIDLNKIICPSSNDIAMQADTLIIPSLLLNTDVGFTHAGFHPHPKTSLYVKEKLVKAIENLNMDSSKFSKKVFISRKDAPKRRIINEDEVFELFEKHGFVRYEMSKLSVLDQILIMQNADIVVGEHGAGLTNILFCKQGTMVIELFQELIDSSDWWVSNLAGLKYIPVNTLDQDTSWAANWRLYGKKYANAWAAKTTVPLDKIQEILEEYLQ